MRKACKLFFPWMLVLASLGLGNLGPWISPPLQPVKAETDLVQSEAVFRFEDVTLPIPGGGPMPETSPAPAQEVIEDPRSLIDPGILGIEDPALEALALSIWDQLLNPAQLQRRVLTDTNFLPGPEYAPFLNQEGFIVDVSDFPGILSVEEMSDLFVTIRDGDPRLFFYASHSIHYINNASNEIFEFHVFPTEAYRSEDPMAASQADYDAVEAQAQAIAQAIMDTTNNSWQRLRLAHDYLVYYLDYGPGTDIREQSSNNVYTAFFGEDQLTKCVGYTTANAMILASMGYPVQNIYGEAQTSYGSELHAWNLVYLEDGWYAIDVTHDDPVLSDYEREILRFESLSIQNFLRGAETMDLSHISLTAGMVDMSQTDYLGGFQEMGRLISQEANLKALIYDALAHLNFQSPMPQYLEFYVQDFPLPSREEISALIHEAHQTIQNQDPGFPPSNYQWYIYSESKHPENGAYRLVFLAPS